MEDTQERTLGEDYSEEETDEVVESEETTEQLKARLEKAESEKERYKNDLLALKKSGKAGKQPKNETLSESAIDVALNRRNEKSVLKRVTDEKDDFFIPELVDDAKFNEIVGYLPRNIDRSSEKSIHKALKLAVNAYKLDKGEKNEKREKNTAAADIATAQRKPSAQSGSDNAESKQKSFKKTSQAIHDWYK
jgi:hypothetical protein